MKISGLVLPTDLSSDLISVYIDNQVSVLKPDKVPVKMINYYLAIGAIYYHGRPALYVHGTEQGFDSSLSQNT